MSHGSNPTAGKRGGGGIIFFIVIAIGAYLLFSNRGGAPGEAGIGNNGGSHSPNEVLGAHEGREPPSGDGLAGGGDFEPRAMPANGGSTQSSEWDIEDVTAKKQAPSKIDSLPQSSSKTQNGDWEIEDASGNSATTDKNKQFQFSSPTSGGTPKAEGGDWSMEDAGKSKSKITENGDWSIEDGGKK